MIRVLVADDHPIFRDGIQQLLDRAPDLVLAAEAVDGEDALRKVRSDSYDVVLLDLSMPGIGGLDVLQRIKAAHPDLPVVVLSMHSEQQYASRVLQAGASGFLTKGGEPSEVKRAIRKAVSGKIYVSATLGEKLADELIAGTAGPPHARLSQREYQVLLAIAAGKRPTGIADELGLSVKTISTYRARILQKLELDSNADLIRYALHEDLIP